MSVPATSAVLSALSLSDRLPNSAMPKYATFSSTVKPFMNVLAVSAQSTSSRPRTRARQVSGIGRVTRLLHLWLVR